MPNQTILDALISGAANGVTIGHADKLAGLAGLLAGKIGMVPDRGYDYYKMGAKLNDDAARESHPDATAIGSVAGLTGASILPILTASKLGTGLNAAVAAHLLKGMD